MRTLEELKAQLTEEIGDTSNLDSKREQFLNENKSEEDLLASLTEEEKDKWIAQSILEFIDNTPDKVIIMD